MFERYTEKARRTIFFARYEASQFGSPLIETEHLLLGVLREEKTLAYRFLRSSAAADSIRRQIETQTTAREKTSTSTDLPLSNESKRVLAYAAEEAERLNHNHIDAEHLFLGLLREEKCLAATLLKERGVQLATVRGDLARAGLQAEPTLPVPEPSLLDEFSRNLTRAALDNQLDPLIGREEEVDRVLQILYRRSNPHAVLIGEPGVGKRTIVAGLAQRVADGLVPETFAKKSILELDLSHVSALESMSKWIDKTREDSPQARPVFLVDDLHVSTNEGAPPSRHHAILKPLIVAGKIHCISLATPFGYAESVKHHAWLQSSFQPVLVAPATPGHAVEILHAIKDRYEKFHGVTYTDDALTSAVQYAAKCLSGPLPGKAIGLMDEAGTRMNAKPLPRELREIQKKIRFIVQHMQTAIANHEFEKARFYSEEERKERNLLQLENAKYGINPAADKTVTVDDIEATLSRMTGMSIAAIQAIRPAEPGSGAT